MNATRSTLPWSRLAKEVENEGTHGLASVHSGRCFHAGLVTVEICMIFPEKSCTKCIMAITRTVLIYTSNLISRNSSLSKGCTRACLQRYSYHQSLKLCKPGNSINIS